MAIENIIMPQLGESVTEGTINTWFIKEGDYVNKYDPIADIMTDKVNAEVPSSFSGTIKDIIVKEGETVPVGAVICTIVTEDVQTSEAPTTIESPQTTVASPSTTENDDSMRYRYSPAVMRLAQEHQIDLTKVKGSGRGGRITRKDIEALIQQEAQVTSKQMNQQPPVAEAYKPITQEAKEVPLTHIRKTIAANMVRSKKEIPHAWMTIEVDVTDLVRLRNQVKKDFLEREGYPLTYFAFFIKAVAQALKEYPQLNSTWGEQKIIQHQEVNISIAVAKENDLFVPVIKRADEKSIKRIAKDIYELAQKVRSGQLTTDDIEGGTFTVNNTGTFGSIHSMGIINYPQAAILQVESIVKRPVVINDMIAIRDMVNLCLSLDHRILDGLVCGRFLARVKDILENTNEKTTPIY